MRPKLFALLLPAVLALSAASAHAANGVTEDEDPYDARLAGYTLPTGQPGPLVIRPASGAAGTWFMTAILGVICFGAMCKNGKRTHMD